MLDETVLTAVKVLFNYGVLGIAAVGLGYLYNRSLAEIRALNALVLELTRTCAQVIEKNTAAHQSATLSANQAAEAQREIAEALRRYADRAGVT